MKNKILGLAVLQLFLMLVSCSSDSGNDGSNPEGPVVVKTAKFTSYSKNSGETGETITMFGENFSPKTSDIKITFDGIAATVVSATTTEVRFTLPQTEKVLPKIAVTIHGKDAVNEVKNEYEGNIGILAKLSSTGWGNMENVIKQDSKIYKIQIFNDKIMYYSTPAYGGGSVVYRTLDGGVTFKEWGRPGSSGAFHATNNDEGWCDTSFGIQKVPVGGSSFMDLIQSTRGDGYYSTYVDNNMKDGTIISFEGVVSTSANGVNFDKVYEAEKVSPNDVKLINSTELDNNHIWAIGYKILKLGSETDAKNRPFILFKNNTTDGWKEYPFVASEEAEYIAREICFVDFSNGFLMMNNFQSKDVKLYKTVNGGDSWTLVYNGEKFTNFTFKDVNTGWAILDDKIYKTTDGGTSWTLDYTHSQAIKNIAYKNNVVWAISKDKIIKRLF